MIEDNEYVCVEDHEGRMKCVLLKEKEEVIKNLKTARRAFYVRATDELEVDIKSLVGKISERDVEKVIDEIRRKID